jgi:putative DNA primase/helicase
MDGKVTRLDEVRRVLDAGAEQQPADAVEDIGISDDELALRFTERHKDSLRYVAAWDRWLIWDGCRWKRDETKRVFDLARTVCRDVLGEHEAKGLTDQPLVALRKRLGSAQTVYAVVKLAGSDPRHAVAVSQLDADPWALNTPDGTLDLRTGQLLPHDPATLMTRTTAAAAKGECPLFKSVLERALPDAEVRAYIQRYAGYALTGLCREHVMAFFYGTGRNGKSVVAHALRHAVGDYGLEIGPEIFMESHHDRHPTETAVLHGARLVVVSEIDANRRWNEARLKRFTGGDPISSRYIGKDLFEFQPTHSLFFVANNKPGLRSVDEAMRARIHLVEFSVTIPESERDATLPERLQAEYGGILAWMVEGCLAYQSTGLAPPASITAATAIYLEAEDSIAQWTAECCERAGQITLKAAYGSYATWCKENSVEPLGRNTFGDRLDAYGFQRGTDGRNKTPVFSGLTLRTPASYHEKDDDADF